MYQSNGPRVLCVFICMCRIFPTGRMGGITNPLVENLIASPPSGQIIPSNHTLRSHMGLHIRPKKTRQQKEWHGWHGWGGQNFKKWR